MNIILLLLFSGYSSQLHLDWPSEEKAYPVSVYFDVRNNQATISRSNELEASQNQDAQYHQRNISNLELGEQNVIDAVLLSEAPLPTGPSSSSLI